MALKYRWSNRNSTLRILAKSHIGMIPIYKFQKKKKQPIKSEDKMLKFTATSQESRIIAAIASIKAETEWCALCTVQEPPNSNKCALKSQGLTARQKLIKFNNTAIHNHHQSRPTYRAGIESRAPKKKQAAFRHPHTTTPDQSRAASDRGAAKSRARTRAHQLRPRTSSARYPVAASKAALT